MTYFAPILLINPFFSFPSFLSHLIFLLTERSYTNYEGVACVWKVRPKSRRNYSKSTTSKKTLEEHSPEFVNRFPSSSPRSSASTSLNASFLVCYESRLQDSSSHSPVNLLILSFVLKFSNFVYPLYDLSFFFFFFCFSFLLHFFYEENSKIDFLVNNSKQTHFFRFLFLPLYIHRNNSVHFLILSIFKY